MINFYPNLTLMPSKFQVFSKGFEFVQKIKIVSFLVEIHSFFDEVIFLLASFCSNLTKNDKNSKMFFKKLSTFEENEVKNFTKKLLYQKMSEFQPKMTKF